MYKEILYSIIDQDKRCKGEGALLSAIAQNLYSRKTQKWWKRGQFTSIFLFTGRYNCRLRHQSETIHFLSS